MSKLDQATIATSYGKFVISMNDHRLERVVIPYLTHVLRAEPGNNLSTLDILNDVFHLDVTSAKTAERAYMMLIEVQIYIDMQLHQDLFEKRGKQKLPYAGIYECVCNNVHLGALSDIVKDKTRAKKLIAIAYQSVAEAYPGIIEIGCYKNYFS